MSDASTALLPDAGLLIADSMARTALDQTVREQQRNGLPNLTADEIKTVQEAKARENIARSLATLRPAHQVTTPAEARAALDERIANAAWSDRFMNGHVETKREFESLTEMVASAHSRLDMILDGTAEAQFMEVTSNDPDIGPALSTDKMSQLVAQFRESGFSDATIRQAFGQVSVTPEEHRTVSALKDQKMANADFQKRYLAGDLEARREMDLMNIVLNSPIKEKTR